MGEGIAIEPSEGKVYSPFDRVGRGLVPGGDGSTGEGRSVAVGIRYGVYRGSGYPVITSVITPEGIEAVLEVAVHEGVAVVCKKPVLTAILS
ncbi:PTS glucose transporter subunit IIA [Paenibacillus albidus]|uniref:PTS glucose transporter subunit IIA n=1 Tax=Paenibacillus albidus TaxID=2041023 RepID=UPI001BE86679|nr:PTS glucose transporter subunit IIA [Paenibacillus albidus]